MIIRPSQALTSRAADLGVQVRDSARRRVRERQHLGRRERVQFEVVVQRAVLVVICDEEQLRPRPRPLDVRRDKTCKQLFHRVMSLLATLFDQSFDRLLRVKQITEKEHCGEKDIAAMTRYRTQSAKAGGIVLNPRR